MVWRAACAKDANDPRRTYLASIAKALSSHHAISNANLAVQGEFHLLSLVGDATAA